MNKMKYISAICGCFLLTACMFSEDKTAVLDKLTGSNPTIKRSDIKFIKSTPVDENNACYTVDIGKKSPVQVPIIRDKNKWVAVNYMEITSDQCINLLKHKVRQEKEKPEAKEAVLQRLKDPDSAKFGNFTLIDDERACLTVNAKNAYGGYTGDKEAWLNKIGGEWNVFFPEDNIARYLSCVEIQIKRSVNALKRQGAGQTGKVLQIHKINDHIIDNFYNDLIFYEVESNGEKLLIEINDIFHDRGRDCKVGDTIEVPGNLPSENTNKKLKEKYPQVISASGKIKVVK